MRINAGLLMWLAADLVVPAYAEEPQYLAEIIFTVEHWHNHGSCIVEIVERPNSDLSRLLVSSFS